MDRMRAHGGQAGFFGTKLISHYVFDSVHGPNWQTRLADWLVGNEFKLILLRRDVVDSTISAYFAQRTSIWHVRNASLTDAFDAVQYDRDRLLEMHSGFTEGATRLEAFAGRLNDVLVIDYADLVMDADVVVRSIAQFVGAAPPNRRLRSDLIRVSAEVPLMQRYRAQLAEDLRRRS
jgi:LPS sulfotransferase NodH